LKAKSPATGDLKAVPVPVDAAHQQPAEAALLRRNDLLNAVVQASAILLAAPSLDAVTETVLRMLGEAMQADRCVLGRMEPQLAGSVEKFVTFDYEWVAAGIPRQIDDPALKTLSFADYPDFAQPLQRGESVCKISTDIANTKAQREQEAVGTQSQFVYPIMVDGALWGCIGADDCHAPREWSAEEVSTMQLVAAAFASIVKREEMTAQRLFAEQCRTATATAFSHELTRRNDLLNVVVEASELLLKAQTMDEVIMSILARLGKGMEADRCCLGQCMPADKNSQLGYAYFAYEWAAPGIRKQTDDPNLTTFNWDQYQDFHQPLLRGEPVSIKTPDISDPKARAEQDSTGAQSQFVYPVTIDGELWGCFYAAGGRHSFGQRDQTRAAHGPED
jgi:GAF domain-containing protein